MLDLVLAGGELERVAALAAEDIGGTVAVMVPAVGLAVAWPPRGSGLLAQLRRYASQRLNGGPAPVPDGLELALPVVSGGDELGVVALLDAPARPGDAATHVLHMTATATVVALAVDGSVPGGDRRGAGLVADLLDGRAALAEDEILVRARRAGAELADGAVACCAHSGELPDRIEASIREAFPEALVLYRDGRSHALLPGGVEATRSALALAARLAPTIPFALAALEPDPGRLGRALREAALAAAVIDAGAATTLELYGGTYRLLLRLASEHPSEVRRFHAETVGPIVEYDERHGTDILRTLSAYLAHDCNMNATAAAIFAHRHTVAYRLERARELTLLDPLKHADRERLGIGLKAHALLRGSARAQLDSPSKRKETSG
jgi:hypothetical protein